MIYISKYFTIEDAFPKIINTQLHLLTDGTIQRLFFIFDKMDQVRDFFGKPLNIHSAYRSPNYNRSVGGAPNSSHMASKMNEAAIDFHVDGLDCSEAQKMILEADMLNKWEMRMENIGAHPTWIHLDTRVPVPGHPRFFIP